MLKNGIIDGRTTIRKSLLRVFKSIDEKGLELISPFNNPEGDYVRPRLYEVGAAINSKSKFRKGVNIKLKKANTLIK